ncbi:ankyrin repeat-containing protein [Acanthamoeba castellanii str. Neff]|uniref:Ankyrin repeat-containing protein n=1 Tax=Acanthamoeba castellanii (strain ATCC 30010 / Neff) TaxID=1257118 RepID=L8HIG7_ACACF|nr:ankyrin repeat-containing protein [Acanthamoeba castellanii str. Neff]ELR25000.1 ankyrin repeat-containing protein [Acanthamoeba castellanii str. Neff]
MQSQPASGEAAVRLDEALFLAAKAGSADDVEELLVRHGVEVNATDHLGNTALHYAAGAGHLAAVLALLARPSLRLNATNNAAWRGNREVVEALVKAGADTTVSNGAGQQPFALAKDSAVAALLEPSSASVEYPDDSDEEEGGGSDSD